MAYDVVAYAPELDPQIAQLQTHLWSDNAARNAAYLRWKYTDNPYLDEVLIRLALHEGRVVAMRGVFGALWEVGDPATRHLLPYADDFVVAPAHRNSGVASRVMKAVLDDAARRDFPFAVSLSAGSVTFVNSLATGWRSAGSYQPLWHSATAGPVQRRLRNLLRRTRLDAMWRTPPPRGPFERLDRHARRGAGRVSLSRDPRPREMAELIGRLPWDGRIRHVRDAGYLAWRFRNPLREYRFLFWDEGGLQGYLVLSDHPDRQSVNIADWEAADERIRAGLLQAALGWGRFARLHAWTVGASAATLMLLRDHGFAAGQSAGVRARSSGLLVYRLGDTRSGERWTLGGRDMLRIADWDLRILYSMIA
jgi:GNAT superfamily N-acetyltransferase